MRLTRRELLQSLTALAGVAHGTTRAESWPSRPVRIVVPFPPGGYADVYARVLAEHMGTSWAQQVTVENRAGAGGVVGTASVASSPGDGYNLLMGTVGTHAINVTLFARLPYDPVTQFTPISHVVEAEGVLVVPASSTARNVQDLIDLARSRKAISFASAGPGTTSHLAGELFSRRNRLSLVHVPYKGNAPALTDLAGGQTAMMFATLQTVLPHLQSGRLRALAVLGALGAPVSPWTRDLPSLAQMPALGQALANWTGLFSGPATPAPVIQKIHAEVQRIMALPLVRARMQTEGMRFVPMGSDGFARFVRSEIDAWRDVVRQSGATMD